MPDVQQPPYTPRSQRKSLQTVAILGGLFVFAAIVFGMLFGAGTFLAGS